MEDAMTLTEFLLARVAEDEAAIRGALDWGEEPWPVAPDRMLARCAADRQIVERHESKRGEIMRAAGAYSWEMRVLAAVYTDHPDYRDEWRP